MLSKRYPLDLMFDRKRNTYWHSDTELQGKVKTVSIDFIVSYFEFHIFYSNNFPGIAVCLTDIFLFMA